MHLVAALIQSRYEAPFRFTGKINKVTFELETLPGCGGAAACSNAGVTSGRSDQLQGDMSEDEAHTLRREMPSFFSRAYSVLGFIPSLTDAESAP